MASKWNTAELARFLKTHSVKGYRVNVPLFDRGIIEQQIRPERGGFIFYKVVADTPIPFSQFAEEMGVETKPLTLKQWTDQYVKGAGAFPAMAWDLQEQLEKGGKVSPADVTFRGLVDRGCIDVDQNVFCYTFPSNDVSIVYPPKKGLGVEISDRHSDETGWPGRIVRYDRTNQVAVVEQFAPVAYMDAPESLAEEMLKKSYALPETWILSKGTAHMLEDGKEVAFPAGKYTEGDRQYLLESPIPLKEIEVACKRYHPDRPECVEQAMMLIRLPINLDAATLRPLPEGTMAADVLVDIGPIPEGEYEHIIWEEEEGD